MRTRTVSAVLGLVAVGVLAGCGDSDDGGGASGGTVSTSEWRAAADSACDTTKSDIAALPASTASLSQPENAEQFQQVSEYLASLADELESLVEKLDDMPQPDDSDDAGQANAVVDALGKALQSLHTAHDAATSDDATAYPGDFSTFETDFTAYTDEAGTAGLTVCSSQAVAD